MTTKERLVELCVGCGMFERDAKKVVELAVPRIEVLVPDYQITWDYPFEDYPKTLFAIWFMTVKEVAVEYIDKNCPQAWYRQMFID